MENILKLKNPQNLLAGINEYNKRKYNTQNAYLARFLGCYKLYTGNTFLWYLFVISCLFVVGIIWRIYDFTQIPKYVNDRNKELDLEIYTKLLINE